MERYINPEKIRLTAVGAVDENKDVLVSLSDVRRAIAQTPTEDVVAVVRCKDCKKRNTPECAMRYECMNCRGQWSWETDYSFCSYGERKEQI